MHMICKQKGWVVNVERQFCLSPLGGVDMLLVSAREKAEHPAVIGTALPPQQRFTWLQMSGVLRSKRRRCMNPTNSDVRSPPL